MNISLETKLISREISELMWKDGITLATAESCTGGAIASAVTRVPGCSDVMLGGVVGTICGTVITIVLTTGLSIGIVEIIRKIPLLKNVV
mgnify:CR=1 FL=1